MLARPRLIAVVAGALLLWTLPVAAQDLITTVEEEWELLVGTPKPAASSPQLACALSPGADLKSTYAVFTINQRNAEASEGGGLQLQLWQGGTLRAFCTEPNTASLATAGERITWTQRMSVANGVLTVAVLSGSSQTWGRFGTRGELALATSTSLTSLNSYDPNVSTANTGIDFGAGCVDKLTLKKIRLYTGNQKSVEQAVERVVYQHP